MSSKYNNQLKTVYNVAAKYWRQDLHKIDYDLSSIKILNRTGSKIVVLLPKFEKQPPAICKIYFSGNGYQNECEGFRIANSIKPVGNITVPKVLQLFPEDQAIITEKINLSDSRLDFFRIFKKRKLINWQDVGKWLRNFHDLNIEHESNNSFIENRFRRINQQLRKLERLFKPDQINKMGTIINTAHANIKDSSIEWVTSHGDFGLGNIKISYASTYIIDFENVTKSPRGHEVINFLAGIESTIYFLYRNKLFKSFFNEFLDGYGMRFKPNPLNNFFYLLTKLDMIANYERRKSVRRISVDKFFSNYLQQEVRKTLSHWLGDI